MLKNKFDTALFRIIGILVVGFSVSILFGGIDAGFPHLASSIIYTATFWEGSWRIILYFQTRYKKWHETKKRIFAQAVTVLIYVLSAKIPLTFMDSYLIHHKPFGWNTYKIGLSQSIFITLLIASIYEAEYFFRLWKNSIIDNEKLKRENLKAQFDTLKNQVNPHFLFNSLNTLSAIITEKPEQAVTFVEKLSALYRYILQYRNEEAVSLSTEIENIESYFYLQSIRFGDNLILSKQLPQQCLAYQLPALSLQVLAENAVKHNVVSAAKPLTLTLTLEMIQNKPYLIVTNNLQAKKALEDSTGLGLYNLMERYRQICAEELFIFKTATDFIVKLPLINPNSYHEDTDSRR